MHQFLFLEFPMNCLAFWGPHTLECLLSIWRDSGCLEEGELFPLKLSEEDLESYFKLNLK